MGISLKWVTRSFPHVDRTSSAWLIKRFIDPQAEFVFINWPEEDIPADATPFDIKGVELGHHNNKCTFETIIKKYNIKDSAVLKIAELVHAADIEEDLDKVPEARGVRAIISGLRLAAKDDYEALELGFKIWDMLYAYYKYLELIDKYQDELTSMDRTQRLQFLREKIREYIAFF